MRRGRSRESAKLTRLMDMLPAMIEEGRRILLFSQFTSMLALIEAELKRSKVDFLKLTGRTKDRAALVEQVSRSWRFAPLPDQPQSRRQRPQSHRRRHRHPLRSLVEPSGRGPGKPTARTGSDRTSRSSSTGSAHSARSKKRSRNCKPRKRGLVDGLFDTGGKIDHQPRCQRHRRPVRTDRRCDGRAIKKAAPWPMQFFDSNWRSACINRDKFLRIRENIARN